MVNLQEFGQWAFPAGYLWGIPSLQKKGFPSSLLANVDLSSHAQVMCPLPWEAFPSAPAIQSLSSGFPRPLSLLLSLSSVTGFCVSLPDPDWNFLW